MFAVLSLLFNPARDDVAYGHRSRPCSMDDGEAEERFSGISTLALFIPSPSRLRLRLSSRCFVFILSLSVSLFRSLFLTLSFSLSHSFVFSRLFLFPLLLLLLLPLSFLLLLPSISLILTPYLFSPLFLSIRISPFFPLLFLSFGTPDRLRVVSSLQKVMKRRVRERERKRGTWKERKNGLVCGLGEGK